MAVIAYSNRWNRVTRQPQDTLEESKAEKLHRLRRPYVALIEGADGDLTVVEMCFTDVYCNVLFLDRWKRVANRYSFKKVKDGQVFLTEAVVHQYASEEAPLPSSGELFRFRTDGSVTHETGESSGEALLREGQTDVSANFAAEPRFGSYESVARRER
jgi:hypothetical protein